MHTPTPCSISRQIAGSNLDSVHLRPLSAHSDQRGSFTELFASQWDMGITPVQWSVVQSAANVFRGMHLHWRHDEYFSLLSGHCLIGLYDLRPDSPTYGLWALYELIDSDQHALVFPPGLLHGWYFYTPSVHIQAVSEAYIDYGDDDNQGCRWDDPTLQIPWGISHPILSERAASFPAFHRLHPSTVHAEVAV